jgi:hypothetical protein
MCGIFQRKCLLASYFHGHVLLALYVGVNLQNTVIEKSQVNGQDDEATSADTCLV